MIQSLFWRYKLQIRRRSFAERAARGGQNQLRDLAAQSGTKTLVRAVMLAIDGYEFGAGDPHRIRDKFAAGDQNFFVCETYALGKPHRLISGVETLHPDNG